MGSPTLIDCDPGTDDALALLLAFGSPELDLRAITVVGGNLGLDRTLPNACAVAGLIAAPPAVHPGADRPLLGAFTPEPRVHGADGLGGVRLSAGPAPRAELAADAIRGHLRASPTPMTVIGLGPATNLALALATEPALAARIGTLILMTGAWGEGNATPAAEFNAFNDPEALAILLAAGAPTVLVGLELTAQALATPARLASLRARHRPSAGGGLRYPGQRAGFGAIGRGGGGAARPLRRGLCDPSRSVHHPRGAGHGRSRPRPEPRADGDRPLGARRRRAGHAGGDAGRGRVLRAAGGTAGAIAVNWRNKLLHRGQGPIYSPIRI